VLAVRVLAISLHLLVTRRVQQRRPARLTSKFLRSLF
jgi:hypothetical protein